MPRFLMSVYAPADPGPFGVYADRDEMRAALAATGAYNDRLRRDGHFVFADGLAPVAAAVTVDARPATPVCSDGPYAEAKEHLGGFWIVDAADRDEALRLAAEASRACRGTVEVRPFAAPPR